MNALSRSSMRSHGYDEVSKGIKSIVLCSLDWQETCVGLGSTSRTSTRERCASVHGAAGVHHITAGERKEVSA